MKILEKLMWTSSAKIRVALTKEDLSLSFTEAVESPNETSDEFQPTEKSINFGKCEIDRETPFVDEIRPDFCEAAAHEHSPATIIPS
ncbi:hypothetical protein BLNAU_10965 [Blattamonas nauphoetae]|uniref:Uncharacterized protein n=1 Tax=Blattamonas nauphoetae TaxID=2049346 RepID=A0ABQ9XP05_9EUKA|nr:hypothetical protein BLNAU_10965 [Blattamonas nauphoetae]